MEARRWRLTHAVPIWGTFLILLLIFLAGLCWGAWAVYDRAYRQPRLAAMWELYAAWDLAVRRAAYAKGYANVNE